MHFKDAPMETAEDLHESDTTIERKQKTVHAYRKLQLMRDAGFEEILFSLSDEFRMQVYKIFKEAVDEVDPKCTIVDIEGVRHLFISPDVKQFLPSLRAKIKERFDLEI